MDDLLCRQFFFQPNDTWHRRYEALRAFFIDGRSLKSIAEQFGYRLSSLKSIVCRFRASCDNGTPPPFFGRMRAVDQLVGAVAKIKKDRNQPRSQIADS
jgi:hypothetical protein